MTSNSLSVYIELKQKSLNNFLRCYELLKENNISFQIIEMQKEKSNACRGVLVV